MIRTWIEPAGLLSPDGTPSPAIRIVGLHDVRVQGGLAMVSVSTFDLAGRLGRKSDVSLETLNSALFGDASSPRK